MPRYRVSASTCGRLPKRQAAELDPVGRVDPCSIGCPVPFTGTKDAGCGWLASDPHGKRRDRVRLGHRNGPRTHAGKHRWPRTRRSGAGRGADQVVGGLAQVSAADDAASGCVARGHLRGYAPGIGVWIQSTSRCMTGPFCRVPRPRFGVGAPAGVAPFSGSVQRWWHGARGCVNRSGTDARSAGCRRRWGSPDRASRCRRRSRKRWGSDGSPHPRRHGPRSARSADSAPRSPRGR
ncbi:hypothetical protein Rruber_03712 [Rhodococcus ruber]